MSYYPCPKVGTDLLFRLRDALDQGNRGGRIRAAVTFGEGGGVQTDAPAVAWARDRAGTERVLVVWVVDPDDGGDQDDEGVLIIDE